MRFCGQTMLNVRAMNHAQVENFVCSKNGTDEATRKVIGQLQLGDFVYAFPACLPASFCGSAPFPTEAGKTFR